MAKAYYYKLLPRQLFHNIAFLGELGTPGELLFESRAEHPVWDSAGSGLRTNVLSGS